MNAREIPFKDKKAIIREIDKYMGINKVSKEVEKQIKQILLNSGGSFVDILTSGEENSTLRNYTLDNLGLKKELFEKFNEIIDSKTYIEPNDLFQDLRSFFTLNYPSLDATIYKYREKTIGAKRVIKSLKLVSGDEKFRAKNININDMHGADYSIEKRALRINGFHKSLMHNGDGGIAAFKINFNLFEDVHEKYVISFGFKDFTPTNPSNKEERSEIMKKIETFIKKGNLEAVVRNKLVTLREFVDDLTGLYNKKYIHAIQNQPYSLITVDINDFKAFNDKNGHQKGDEILKELGQIFRDSIRFNDRACRNGGDEFLLFISSGRNTENEQQILDLIKQRIHEKIRALNILRPGNLQYGITMGHSKFDTKKTFAIRLKEADDSMYNEKPIDGRRNRIVSQNREFIQNETVAESKKLVEQLAKTILESGKTELIDALREQLYMSAEIKK